MTKTDPGALVGRRASSFCLKPGLLMFKAGQGRVFIFLTPAAVRKLRFAYTGAFEKLNFQPPVGSPP